MRGIRNSVIAAAAFAAVIGGTSAASTAAPIGNVHEQLTETWVETDFCGSGLDVPVTKVLAEHRLDVRKRGPQGLVWFSANFSEVLTYVNPLTGASITLDRRFTDRDAKLTSNSDGTYLYTEALTGIQRTLGPDGSQLFVDAGVTRFQLLLDADLRVLAFVGVSLDRGHKATAGRDFCADFFTSTS